MKTENVIDIAQDFSDVPWGRYASDGDQSGEVFRTKYLVPSLRSHKKTIVVLDGVEGFGSSFLEEAFGGLVRVEGFTQGNLLGGLLEVRASQRGFEMYKNMIISYIKSAKPGVK